MVSIVCQELKTLLDYLPRYVAQNELDKIKKTKEDGEKTHKRKNYVMCEGESERTKVKYIRVQKRVKKKGGISRNKLLEENSKNREEVKV